jgi:hypothetical protein
VRGLCKERERERGGRERREEKKRKSTWEIGVSISEQESRLLPRLTVTAAKDKKPKVK